MGERGPKPKTEAELRATGSWRKSQAIDEIETEIPQSGRGLESPPSWLTPEEVKIWEDFLPKALEMKTYSNADYVSFGMFCKATCALIESGFIYHTYYMAGTGDDSERKEKPMKHPLLDIYHKFADQFGFNPQARTRLKIVPYTKAPAPSVGAENAESAGKDESIEMMGITKTT